MSRARPVFKGVTLMLTRRVRGRQFRLRPCDETNQIVGYVVAVMQKKWNIRIHAIKVLSNHWHLVLTDPDGNIVDFQRDCHNFIASALNTRFDDTENLWASPEAGSRVECEEPSDTVAKIAYTMANGVEAGLVRYGDEWPGIRMAWPCAPRRFKRPPMYFRGIEDGGTWPEEAELVLSRPPGYDDLTDDELADVIGNAIFEREEGFRREYDATGRRFLGAKAVRKQSRYACPKTRERRFGISPKVACKDKWRRIERLRANRAWLDAYTDAMARWRRGDRDVVFPYGTYKMRVVHDVRCADPPT